MSLLHPYNSRESGGSMSTAAPPGPAQAYWQGDRVDHADRCGTDYPVLVVEVTPESRPSELIRHDLDGLGRCWKAGGPVQLVTEPNLEHGAQSGWIGGGGTKLGRTIP